MMHTFATSSPSRRLAAALVAGAVLCGTLALSVVSVRSLLFAQRDGSAASGRPRQSGDLTKAGGDLYFREPFEAGAPRYGFEWAWPEKGRYSLAHLPTGGWDGKGAAHVAVHPGHNDYNLGWIISPLKRTFSLGDAMYIRFRIRFDDDYRGFIEREGSNKFILIGQTRTTPNSRIIVFIEPPNDSVGCALGQVDYLNNTGPFKWAAPEHFGLSGSFFSTPNLPNYGSISPYVNIDWIGNCAPPALVTYGNNPKPPMPGPYSAKPVDGWYHFQIYAESGPPGKGAFKTWANNNMFEKPTSQQIGLRGGLGVTGWGNSQLYVGGYQNGIPKQTLGFRLDDFELGGSFDPRWYPGGK